MKYKFLKVNLLVASILMLGATSCVKKYAATYWDASTASDFVILMGSGLSNFKASNLLVNTASPDTLSLTVTAQLASPNSNSGPVTVTLGLDSSAITAYNSANGTNFQPFPASAYKFVSTTVTIPGGLGHYASTTVWVFQNQLDPSVSYILPVAIKNGGGKNLSGNQNVIYYNVIGNPLAGNYLQDFYRWNGTSDTTTPPNSTVFTGQPAVVAPIDPLTVVLPESYMETFLGVGVDLSFTNTAGVLSNFQLFLDASELAAFSNNGFTVVTAPKLVGYGIVGNAGTHYAGSWFRTFVVLLNSGGATRTCIDQFVKQ